MNSIREEDKILCGMLAAALNQEAFAPESESERENCRNGALVETAKKHKVVSLLYEIFEQGEFLPEDKLKAVQMQTRQTVQQSYRLLFLTKYVVHLLEENQIKTVVLKGVSAAAFYPVAEYRKSGDIDLLLSVREDAERAGEILKTNGFWIKEGQHANHHFVYTSPEGIDVELHIMLAEPFDNEFINQYLERKVPEFIDHSVRSVIMGVELPVPQDGYLAFHLLLHMLQHFLRSGFGLKLLCDWTVFWNHSVSEQDRHIFLSLVKESGTEGFAKVVTDVCVQYLGLKKENVEFLVCGKIQTCAAEELLAEVLEAEEFGKSSSDRMVAIRGTKPTDYMREFHHQVKLTYPKASKYVLCLPVLWGMMLVGFFYRNRTLRKVSSIAILKKAGKRSKMINQLELFGGKRKKS